MITLTEIHIATNCTGELQRTKKIKPLELESPEALEPIREKVQKRYHKKGFENVNVFFVWYE